MTDPAGVVYVNDKYGHETFRITFTSPPNDTSASFTVQEMTGYDPDGSDDQDGYTPYLTGTIKWDSCSHLYFGEDSDGDGYIHMCGRLSFENHVLLLRELYASAFDRMGREPMSGEEWV